MMAKATKKRQHRSKTKSGSDAKATVAKGRLKEIVFDPEARREHLCGFSERKRQRRAYGLAMQKVKDRKGKLEARRERTIALREQVLDAEKQKMQLAEELLQQTARQDETATNNEEGSPSDRETTKKPATVMVEYKDEISQDQWGGNVVVTTSTHIPDDDDDSRAEPPAKRPKRTDAEQEYAGKVERYLERFKGNMPRKKRTINNHNKPRIPASARDTSSASHSKNASHGQRGIRSKGKDSRTRRVASRK